MAEFRVPAQPQLRIKEMGNFLGVDFTSVMPNERRASNMINLINDNGYIETRPGYVQEGTTFGEGAPFVPYHINGVWNIDRENDSIMVVHAGTKLYSTTDSFETHTVLLTGLNDKISSGFYSNNYLIILDGKRAIIYGKFGTNWEVGYLDQKGYVPTIGINFKHDGTGGEKYEMPNLLTSARQQTFLSDGLHSEYKLLETELDDTVPTIAILDIDGEWKPTIEFTYDKSLGKITFTNPPPASPIVGHDNIRIIYHKTNAEYLDHVNKATIGVLFGYEGNNNRLFITGEPGFKHIDWYSAPNNPLYFPDDNYATIGSQPIVSYLLLNNGKLAVLKNISDTDYTVYYRNGYLFNGKEAFPVEYGVRSVGTLSSYTADNLLNDPLILTTNGMCGLVSNGKEDYAHQRSFYLNKKLLAEENLESAVGIAFKDKYYLAVNNHVYVLDGRYKGKIQDSTSNFQYDGYYWENVPVRVFFQYENELYFGTSDGKIVKFDNTICYDYVNTSPIKCLFETTYLDFGTITTSKTIKQIAVISKPEVKTAYTLSYTTDDEVTEIITNFYGADDFPKSLVEKEKIKKFNFVKFGLSNNTLDKMSFYQLGFKYIYSGKYRGE